MTKIFYIFGLNKNANDFKYHSHLQHKGIIRSTENDGRGPASGIGNEIKLQAQPLR
jgi:hypothetical protein